MSKHSNTILEIIQTNNNFEENNNKDSQRNEDINKIKSELQTKEKTTIDSNHSETKIDILSESNQSLNNTPIIHITTNSQETKPDNYVGASSPVLELIPIGFIILSLAVIALFIHVFLDFLINGQSKPSDNETKETKETKNAKLKEFNKQSNNHTFIKAPTIIKDAYKETDETLLSKEYDVFSLKEIQLGGYIFFKLEEIKKNIAKINPFKKQLDLEIQHIFERIQKEELHLLLNDYMNLSYSMQKKKEYEIIESLELINDELKDIIFNIEENKGHSLSKTANLIKERYKKKKQEF